MTTLSNIKATEAQFRQFDYTLSMLGIPLDHSIHESGFQLLFHIQKLPPPFQSILSQLDKFSPSKQQVFTDTLRQTSAGTFSTWRWSEFDLCHQAQAIRNLRPSSVVVLFLSKPFICNLPNGIVHQWIPL
jgi:hypothetical protein